MTGAELVAIRKQLGWTQRKMGEELGYTPTYVAMCERYERPVPPRMAKHVLTLQAAVRVCEAARELGRLLGIDEVIGPL
jgi:transcriptional regulator with XRE-family HTH domain